MLSLIPAASAAGTEYHPSNGAELQDALQDAVDHPGSVIILEGKDYVLGEGFDEDEEGYYDNYGCSDVDGLTIRGTQGTRMLIECLEKTVIVISSSTVTMENLTLGHTSGKDAIYEGICGNNADVIYVGEQSDLTIKNCDLFGCGWTGLNVTDNSNVSVENSVIHDCSNNAVCVSAGGKVSCVGCQFSGNGYARDLDPEAWELEYAEFDDYLVNVGFLAYGIGTPLEIPSVSFVDCDFTDNRTPHFVETGYGDIDINVSVQNCTFSDNAWPEAEHQALNNAAPIVNVPMAYASTQTVSLDGKPVTFACYALKDKDGNMTNYIKLRDLAMLLNGTAAQFDVKWDTYVTITPKTAYTPNGSELSTPFTGDRIYQALYNSLPTFVGSQFSPTFLNAFVLNDDLGGGYTYYRLRDLGKALGFNVGWTADKGVFVETDKPYDANN